MKLIIRVMMAVVMGIIASGVLVACGGAPATSTASTPLPTRETPAAPNTGLQHASAPAEEDFREDSHTLVAATGRPQLIEVFSYD